MKLNIGCGNRTKQNFCNIDSYERDNKLDLIIDITKEFPFENDSVDFVYIEHFLEHLNWIEGKELLQNCYNSLKEDGIIRIVIPHFRKIFEKYIEGDLEFFEPYFKNLNGPDFEYYSTVYHEPEKIRKRKQNKPPEWHFIDKNRVRERIRHYDYLIDILNYMIYQYGEHCNLLDYISLKGLLENIGFRQIEKSEYKEDFDSSAKTRVDFSLYVECIK